MEGHLEKQGQGCLKILSMNNQILEPSYASIPNFRKKDSVGRVLASLRANVIMCSSSVSHKIV